MSATLADFDDDFTTATATRPGGDFDLKDLPDGEYEFEVAACESKDTQSGPIVSMKLMILSDGKFAGKKVERAYFLTKKDEGGARVKNENQIAELRKDLGVLGFDVENWTNANGRPFSKTLPEACRVMQGCGVKGKKKQNGKFANLYLNERLATDGKPAKFGADELKPEPEPFSV